LIKVIVDEKKIERTKIRRGEPRNHTHTGRATEAGGIDRGRAIGLRVVEPHSPRRKPKVLSLILRAGVSESQNDSKRAHEGAEITGIFLRGIAHPPKIESPF
jgi:hypothetical protein